MGFRIIRERFSHMGACAKQKRNSKGMENTHASYWRFCTHVPRSVPL